MVKMMLFAALMGLSGLVEAGPYFRMKPLTKMEAGVFYKIGTPQGGNSRLGLITPVIWHDSKDGYWLLPGVDWQLLNFGVITDTELRRGSVLFGPGVEFDEAIKSLLRRGLAFLPGWQNDKAYGFLHTLLAPSEDGKDNGYLSVGPMWGLTPSPGYDIWDVAKLRGSLQIGVKGAARFGGSK